MVHTPTGGSGPNSGSQPSLTAAFRYAIIEVMRRVRVAAGIAAILSLVACGGIQPPRAPGDPALLAVLAWNMNAGRGDLPRLIADLESGRLSGAPPVDYVLLLQEATQEVADFAEGRSARRMFVFFVPVWNDGRVTRGNALISTVPLMTPRAIVLPQERQPRGAVAAAIDVAGHGLFVVSAHLENRAAWLRGGVLDEAARGRQAEALLRALPAHEPGIVGGDMNTLLGPNEPAWRAFRQRFTDTPPDDHVPAATFRERLTLDHLFFDVPDGWRPERRVLPDRYRSDHHPVLGLLRQ
jgi:endonuclease/exonuclease/phosphatase (EEP) superfamily protein YafD